MSPSSAPVLSEAPTALERPAHARRTRRRRLSESSQWAVIATAQFRDYLRTHRFVGLVAFVALVSGVWLFFLVQAGTGLVQLSFLNSVSEFLTDYMQSTPLWIILAAAFFGGDALSVDYNTGAGYYTLVLPVKRRTLLAGRYASACAVTLVVVLEYTAFGVLGAAYAFGRDAIPWTSLGTSLGLAVLFTLAVVSVAFFFSSFFESPATGVLVTILVLAVGFTTLQDVVQVAGYEPWWSLIYAGERSPPRSTGRSPRNRRFPSAAATTSRRGPRPRARARRSCSSTSSSSSSRPRSSTIARKPGGEVRMASIEMNHVTKWYRAGTAPVLDDVDFRYEGTGAIGYLGPNGAGKSTTLKLLVGLLAPSKGSVRLNGVDPMQDREARGRTGSH